MRASQRGPRVARCSPFHASCTHRHLPFSCLTVSHCVSHGGSAVHQALQPRSGNESSKAPASDLEELTKRCDNFRRAASALQQENTALRAKVLENKELVSVVATLRAENSALRAANLRLREIRGLADAAHENDEENFSPVDGQRVQLVPALTEESEARVFPCDWWMLRALGSLPGRVGGFFKR